MGTRSWVGDTDAFRLNSALSASDSPCGVPSGGFAGKLEGDTLPRKLLPLASGKFGFCGMAGGGVPPFTELKLDGSLLYLC